MKATAIEAAVRDPERLAVVRGTELLDAATEEVFDRLSRLAVRLVGVPAAFLSLVDEHRDFYLSACGFGEPLASARELTGPTFCHHAILAPGPLVIPDTAADPAYRDVPTVRTLGVAAYVGVPITLDGQRVGSFCAIDTRPRAWTAGDLEVLTELAAAAERELALRGAARRAAATEAHVTGLLAESEAARAALTAANAQLGAQQRELAAVNEQLQQQAAELQISARQLQEQQAELEVQSETLREANVSLETALADAVRARHVAEAARVEAWAARDRLARVGESGIVGLFFWDLTGGITEANDAFLSMLGYTQADLAAGRVDWRRLTPPEYAERDEDAVRELMATGRHGQYAKEYFAKDGRPVPVVLQSAFLDGTRTQGVCVCLDDSARRAATAALAESEARFRHVADHAPVMLRVTEADGRCSLLNRAWLGFTGQTLEEGLGAGWLAAVHPDDAADAERVFLDATARAAPFHLDYRLRRADGAYRRAVDVAAPRLGPAGEFLGYVGSVVDVEERAWLLDAERAARASAEEAWRAAEEARDVAEAANAAKSQFLANMSHELRTPLNAIAGYTELLDMGLHGPVTVDQRGALARVQGAQRRLLALINDVLNYAKLEGGRIEYDMHPVDVRDVVADVVPLVEPQLAAKGLAFAVRLPETPGLVWADRDKLGQVLVNLLSNAVKFTDARHPVTGVRGRVLLDLKLPARGSAVGRAPSAAVVLRVSDSGRGIPRGRQDSVFEPFVQVRAAYGSPHEGTGLGLSISRDLARGMGGELRVRSREGSGSIFSVTLRRVVDATGHPTDRRATAVRRTTERRSGDDRRDVAAEDGAGVR